MTASDSRVTPGSPPVNRGPQAALCQGFEHRRTMRKTGALHAKLIPHTSQTDSAARTPRLRRPPFVGRLVEQRDSRGCETMRPKRVLLCVVRLGFVPGGA